MFYLTTHSTHFIYGYMVPELRKKEENVLFNDALNTFYLQLYGTRVKEERLSLERTLFTKTIQYTNVL